MDDQTLGLVIGLTVGLLGAAAGVAVPVMMLRGTFSRSLATKPAAGLAPVNRGVLLQRLQSLNSVDQPFLYLPSDRYDLVAEWRVADASWWGFFSRNHLEISYRAKVVLREEYGELRLVEEFGRVAWSAGVEGPIPRVSWQKQFFKGVVLFQRSREIAYALKDDAPVEWGKVLDYDFDVWRIKGPLLRVAVESGWAFVPCVQESHLRANRPLT